MQGGTVVAAYGSGITEDWLTTGVCFDTVSILEFYLVSPIGGLGVAVGVVSILISEFLPNSLPSSFSSTSQ